uniref:Chondroitin proteoglycan 3 n=1 Tax=Caenorhabditis japonica TaxID=281687 RepID=A0A8R1HT95_CAEJA
MLRKRTSIIPLLLVLFCPLNTSRNLKNLEDDVFLQLLEVEIARTLRGELATDEDLQLLEGSGGLAGAEETTSTSTTTTTTTVAPTTTTPKPPKPTQCIADKNCFKDAECPAGKCLGSELGLCDCNACITNKKCSTDSDCGGLRNACDVATGYCDCVSAFHSHGYKLFVKVLLTFCHQTKCSETSDNCYGLPCRVGKCRCAQGASNLPVHYFTTG